MGMVIFEESGTFNPSDWGLESGDMLQIICVGGGAGGDLVDGGRLIKGNAGGQSSFGSYIVAKGGNTDNSFPSGMSRGGAGASKNDFYAYGGGGAGGYLPGISVYGGDGGDAYYTDANFSGTVFFNKCAPSGLGGVGRYGVPSNFMPLYYNTMFANLKYCGGNRGSGAGDGTGGAGGNGYGAGGGAGTSDTSSSLKFDIGEYCGGNSGELVIGSVKLTSSSAISIIIGSGGDGGNAGEHHGGSGAPGVIIVTW